MESFTLGRLARAIGASAPPGCAAIVLRGVSTDSRHLEEGAVFFALSGERFDATRFVAAAFERGARAAVVPADATVAAGLPVLRVPDVRRALLDFASSYREEMPFRVVAVTGSAGKTTTKDLLFDMVRGRFRAVKAPKSFNNDVGLPLTLLSADRETQVVVVELGTNNPGEIATIAAVARPDVAVITCIGHSHLEGLGSVEGVAREKLSILPHVQPGGAVVLNGDDLRLRGAASALTTVRGSEFVTLVGFGEGLRWRARVTERGLPWRVATAYEGCPGPDLELSSPGEHFALDALLAMAAAQRLGVPPWESAAALASFTAPPGRLNVVRAGGVTLVDDTYNANPTSVCASLEAFASLAPPDLRVAVLGDMLELGPRGPEHHRAVGKWVARLGVGTLVTVGSLSREIGAGAAEGGLDPKRIVSVDVAAEVPLAIGHLEPESAVLFKASRGCRLERAFAATRDQLRGDVSGALRRAA